MYGEETVMELKLKLDNIDYGKLAVKLLPLVAHKLEGSTDMAGKLLNGVAKMPPVLIESTINALPQETKDELAALLINKNKERMKDTFISFAEAKGIGFDIVDIEADCSK